MIHAPIATLTRQFESLGNFLKWQEEETHVQTLSPYKSMSKVVNLALDFLKEQGLQFLGIAPELMDNMNIEFSSIDKGQGDTCSIVVFAPPQGKDWNMFSANPSRLLTYGSRAFRTLAVPDSIDFVEISPALHKTLQCLTELRRKATVTFTWSGIAKELGMQMSAKELWKQWKNRCDQFLRDVELEQATQRAESNWLSLKEVGHRRANPCELRSCPLTFLRSFRSFLSLTGNDKQHRLEELITEIHVQSQNASKVTKKRTKSLTNICDRHGGT